jgi:hypothetical protein
VKEYPLPTSKCLGISGSKAFHISSRHWVEPSASARTTGSMFRGKNDNDR